jgi:hypothetical protein
MAELRDVEVTPARVRVAVGYTMNMGDFESLRYDVAIEASAKSGESASAAVDRVSELAESKLMAKLTEFKEELKN